MKFAILSDIHGNMAALEAMATHIANWQPDFVVVNGDTVNRGPDSLAAWQFVQTQSAWQLLKGNHEEYVIRQSKNGAEENGRSLEENGRSAEENGRLLEIYRMSYWTFLQHQKQVAGLADLQDGLSLWAPDGSELRIRHASMESNRDGIWPEASLDVMRKKIGSPSAVFATAHIHRPFVCQVDETLLVNSGSVGTPADGDPRASYAQIVWKNGRWTTEIIRVTYNRAATRQAYITSGFLAEAGVIGWLSFYEWQQARSVIPGWIRRYFEPVMAGEIMLETAVTRYLTELGLSAPPS
jgi:predicted phosphodiesterase